MTAALQRIDEKKMCFCYCVFVKEKQGTGME